MKDDKTSSDAPILRKGDFLINFSRAVGQFENAMQEFPIKKLLYQSVFQGRGLEFESYREFMPDDDASLLDWRASLRANQLLARKYIQERNLNIYFLVDVSNSMLFGSNERLKAEYTAEVVAALSHLVLNSGDRVGIILFNEGIVKILRPNNSKTQFSLFMKFLSDPSLYGGGFDLKGAVEYAIENISSEYTAFILVSDFIRVNKNVERSLKLMGSKFETMALLVRDPMDDALPDTGYQMSVQDPYSGRQMVIDSSIAGDKFRQSAEKQKGVLKDLFKQSKIDVLELSTSEHFAVPVATFLKNRSSGRRT